MVSLRKTLAWYAAVVLVASAVPASLVDDDANTVAQSLTEAERQLNAREFEAASTLATQLVAEIEADGSQYDRMLVEPLRLLGDAHVGLGDTAAALVAYERARHIVRTTDGLDTPAQVPILELEAAVFESLRDWKSANDRHETIFNLALARHGRTPALVPALVRLADWYRENRLLHVANEMYIDAVELLEAVEPMDAKAVGEIYHKIGLTYREYRWPAAGQRTVRIVPMSGMRIWGGNRAYTRRYAGIAGMFKGTKALKKATSSLQQSRQATLDQVLESILDDGDTLTLFQRYGRARGRYADAFEYLSETHPEQIAEIFAEPVPIFEPHPGNLRMSRASGPGLPARIEFSVTVNKRGAVRRIKTLAVEPPGLTIYDYRRAARETRYRPAIVDGKPVAVDGVPIVFDFKYFPG